MELCGVGWKVCIFPLVVRVLSQFMQKVRVDGIKHVYLEGMRGEIANLLMQEAFTNVVASFRGGAKERW